MAEGDENPMVPATGPFTPAQLAELDRRFDAVDRRFDELERRFDLKLDALRGELRTELRADMQHVANVIMEHFTTQLRLALEPANDVPQRVAAIEAEELPPRVRRLEAAVFPAPAKPARRRRG